MLCMCMLYVYGGCLACVSVFKPHDLFVHVVCVYCLCSTCLACARVDAEGHVLYVSHVKKMSLSSKVYGRQRMLRVCLVR